MPEANIEVRTIKRFTALSLEIAFEVESHLTNLTCPLAPGGRLRPWFLLFTVMFQLLAFVLALLDLGVAESCGVHGGTCRPPVCGDHPSCNSHPC